MHSELLFSEKHSANSTEYGAFAVFRLASAWHRVSSSRTLNSNQIIYFSRFQLGDELALQELGKSDFELLIKPLCESRRSLSDAANSESDSDAIAEFQSRERGNSNKSLEITEILF